MGGNGYMNTTPIFYACALYVQVGCGAIGCEMLKNYAMLGVGRKPNGLVRVVHTHVHVHCTEDDVKSST